MSDEKPEPFTLRVRPLPEKIAYLAAKLRQGEDPMLIAVALEAIALELEHKAEPREDTDYAWFSQNPLQGRARFDHSAELKHNIGKH